MDIIKFVVGLFRSKFLKRNISGFHLSTKNNVYAFDKQKLSYNNTLCDNLPKFC